MKENDVQRRERENKEFNMEIARDSSWLSALFQKHGLDVKGKQFVVREMIKDSFKK